MALFTMNKTNTLTETKTTSSKNVIQDTINDAYNMTSELFSNGKSFLDATTTDVSQEIDSLITGLFEDKSNIPASKINTPVPDPIKGNFSKTNNKTSVFSTQTINNKSISQNTNITSRPIENEDIVRQRYMTEGSTSSNTLYPSIFDATKSNSVASLLTSTTNIVESVPSSISALTNIDANIEKQINKEYLNLTGSLSNVITGTSNGLMSTLDRTLSPTIATVDGVISDTLSSYPVSMITSLGKTITELGCSIPNILSTTKSTSRSLYNTLLSLTSSLNMPDFLGSLLNCSKYDQSSIDITKKLFKDNLDKNTGISGKLSEKLDPVNLYMSPDELKKLVVNTDPLDAETSKQILKKAQVELDNPFISYNTTTNQNTYDLKTIQETNSNTIAYLLDDSEISSYKVLSVM